MSLLASLGPLLLASLGFMTYDFLVYKTFLVERMSSLAEIVSISSVAAVTGHNRSFADKMLASLKARSTTLSAGIYTQDGKLFASWNRDARAPAELPPLPPLGKVHHHFDRRSLTVFHPLALANSAIGTIYVQSDLSELTARLRWYIGITLLVLIISVFAAAAIAFKVGQKISDPILQLAEVAKSVSEKKDYSVRAEGGGADEMGLLIRTFNAMLIKIQDDGQALQVSAAQFRQLADSIPQLSWMADEKGAITWYNQRWYDYTGKTPQEMEGWGWQSVHDPKELPRVMELWTRAIAEGKAWEDTFPMLGKDNVYRWFLSRAMPIRDSHGTVVHWFGTNTDINVNRQAEQEIQRLSAGLEQKVADRTAQLTAANQALEAFSYSVSHDLRAPLRHIGGFTELLSKLPALQGDATVSRYLKILTDSVREMGALIDDLLSFSRMARTEMLKGRVNLDQIVGEILHDFKPQMEGRRVEWKVGPLPEVHGDPAMLRLVFVNLISNALKYSRKRDQAVIEIGASNASNKEWIFFVRDNGVGFDMKYVAKLFGVFQRLHSSDEFDGTGIGLATVRRIIERHGGRAWGEGVVDGGATFYVALPVESTGGVPT